MKGVKKYTFCKVLYKSLLLVLLFVVMPNDLFSQSNGDYRSRRDGTWNDVNDWQIYNNGWRNANAGDGYPGQNAAGANVTIRNRHNLTLNVTPANSIASLTIDSDDRSTDLTCDNGMSLNVTGAITLDPSTQNNQHAGLYVNNGNITCGSLVSWNSNNNRRDCRVRINTGTLTVTGDINMGNNTNRNDLTFIGAGTLQIGGDITSIGTYNPNYNGCTVELNGTGAQNLSTYTYHHLNLSGAGPFSALGNITVNGDFSAAGQINTTNNFTLNGTTSCGGSFNATGGTITYTNSTLNVLAGTYNNLTKNGGGTSALCGNVNVSNTLNLSSGIIRLGGYNLTISNTGAGAITGTFSATNMIETDGTGYLVKQSSTNAGFSIVYPIGSGGYYTPMDLTNGITASYTGTADISVRAVSGGVTPTVLRKYWEVLSRNITSITSVYPLFTYNVAEVDGVQATYDPWFRLSGGSWAAPANPTATGANPFGSSNETNLAGEWTAGTIPPADITTYYSYQSGDWNSISTWTHDPGGTTQTATDLPDDIDRVVILSGRTVTLPADIATLSLDVTINDGGSLDQATYQFTSGLAALRGQGIFKLASTNFPVVTTNAFVATGGGTTEYYNASSFTLPAAQTEYNNLTINSPGNTATQLSNLTLNGDLNIKTGTFQINDGTATRR
ncbi:MAG: hypothetical protein MI922_24395, partial [Bacteroidales bacterium]|nr:hypothetical protein [Bacteroidales bacterium]